MNKWPISHALLRLLVARIVYSNGVLFIYGASLGYGLYGVMFGKSIPRILAFNHLLAIVFLGMDLVYAFIIYWIIWKDGKKWNKKKS